MHDILIKAWQEYLLYRNISLDLYETADSLYKTTRNKLAAFKIYDEGDKLYKIGLSIWEDAVYKIYGNIEIIWKYRHKGYSALLPDSIYKFERW